MSDIVKMPTKIISSILLTATCALADCPIDTNGLRDTNGYDGVLPNDHINAEGARTLDDFVNATANELFFTQAGTNYIIGEAGELLFYLGYAGADGDLNIPPIVFYGHACNEIGQCVDTATTLRSTGTDSSVLDWFSGFMTRGQVTGLNSNLNATDFSITATDARGNSSPVRDFLTSSILNQQQRQQNFTLSTDGNNNIDTRCRNNKGKLTGGTAEGNGGGGNIAPVFDYYIPTPAPPNLWKCWATPTGVACRR